MSSSVTTWFGTLLVFLRLLSLGSPQSECLPRDSLEGRLKKCLLEKYEKTVRPVVSNTDTVITAVHLYLRFIDLNEVYHTMDIHSWTSWEWKDAFLTWDPANYNNLRVISISSDDIWNPDVSLLTTSDEGMHRGIPSTLCKVASDGAVHCIPPTTLKAHCAPDFTNWPFDVQTCVAQFGSWSYFSSSLNLTLAGRGFSVDHTLPSKLWEIVSVAAVVSTKTFGSDLFPVLKYEFVVRRHSGSYAATAVIPAFVLAVMTLIAFMLEPDCTERLTMNCCGVIGHILFLQYMSWAVPPNGDNVPTLVVFFRDSLLVVGSSLAVTVCTRTLLRMRTSPPDWLRSAVAAILSTPPGQLLLLGRLSPRGAAAASGVAAGEDADTLVSSNDVSSGGDGRSGEQPWRGAADPRDGGDGDAWRLTAVLVDRLTLIVFGVALLMLFARYAA